MLALDAIVFGILSILNILIAVLSGRSAEKSRHRNKFYWMGAVSILCIAYLGVRGYQIQTESSQLQEEVTGGDSFCYVEAREVSLSGGLIQVSVLGKGKNPISGVTIRIVDLDEADKHPGVISKAEQRFDFPFPTRYAGFLKPLYGIKPSAETVSKRFNIFIHARNGVFTGLLRLQRVANSWAVANRVFASYYHTKRSGIVLEEIDRNFPKDVLKSDSDWNATEKLKRIKVGE
jgi:hypothetical protein